MHGQNHIKYVVAVYNIVRTDYRISRLLVLREIFTASRYTEWHQCVELSGVSFSAVISSEGRLPNSHWLCFKDIASNLTSLNQFTTSQDVKLWFLFWV